MIIVTKWKETEIGRIPEAWEIVNLGNLLEEINKGISYKSDDYCSEKEGRIFINLKCVGKGKFRQDGIKYYKGEIKQSLIVHKGDVLIANTDLTQNGEVIGAPIRIPELSREACFSMDLTKLVPKGQLDKEFMYYYLLSPFARNFMVNSGNGTTVVHLDVSNIPNLPVPLPTLAEQRAIAKILSDLDSKIELNNQMNATLEAMTQAIFKHWFVDFEFPDENGKPYKSSGGEMVDSELGKIPGRWKIKILGEISKNFDSKRVPLSSRERTERKGQYPYYGATGILDYVDKYIFDGTYILMGEDGSVIDKMGYPILQYVWGKFWVNNHAHVLKGNGISDELLYILLKNTNVSHIITGAVQPKINQGNMNDLKYAIPDQATLLKISKSIMPMFNKIKSNYEQIGTLTKLRDSLIPKLMSGQIRVPIEVLK